jgi:hypothetical protein
MRNRRSFFHCLSLCAAVLVTGCVTTWSTTAGPQKATKLGVTADLPAGWARFNPEPGIVMTKDGLLLQTIRISRDKFGTRIPNTELTIGADADAQEAAQIMIDVMSADQSRQHVTVVDNRPTTVGGHPGFRLEVTYETAAGLVVRETIYLALTPDSYVIARYSAPNRVYHERDLAAFERVVQSLKIDEPLAKK